MTHAETVEADASTQDGEEQTITEDTLISVRLQRSNYRGYQFQLLAGDKENYFGEDIHKSFRSMDILSITAGSLLENKHTETQTRLALMAELDQEVGFDSFKDEAHDNFGRHPFDIVLEEQDGQVWEDMADINNNIEHPYLYSYSYQVPLSEAYEAFRKREDLSSWFDGTYYIPDGDEILTEVRGASGARVTAVEVDNVRLDITEFIPTVGFLKENRRRLFGMHNYEKETYEPEYDLSEFIVEQSGDIIDIVTNVTTEGITHHEVREVDEAIVDDEGDMLVTACGNRMDPLTVPRFLVDEDSLETERGLDNKCGLCFR